MVVGRRARRLWPVATSVVVIVVAYGVVWMVWQSPDREELSTFGAFAVAVIVLVGPRVTFVTKMVRRPGDTGRGQPPSDLADSLADAVKQQWNKAARDRRLIEPKPIPVHWRKSSRPLAGPASNALKSRQFPPLPGLSATVLEEQVQCGRLEDLHAVYGGWGRAGW